MDRPLREVFDAVAERYDPARPGDPEELFDDIAALTGLTAGDRVLEIRPDTGLDVEVVNAAFEDWPLPPVPVAAVVAATAFHWLDAEVRLARAAT